MFLGSNRSEEQSRYDKKVNGEGLLSEGNLFLLFGFELDFFIYIVSTVSREQSC